MTDEATVKAKLRQLATTSENERSTDSPSRDDAYKETIERATAALDDLDAAAAFLEHSGIDDLERAVETATQSMSACVEQGRTTLATYRRLQAAVSGDQFHSGRGTSLGDGDKIRTR